jgi:DNA-binding SARP family transcriptional activator
MDVRACLFGDPRIVVGEHCVDGLSSSGLAIFAMLVTRPHEAISGDEIAFSLWRDRPESKPHAALRRELYELERAFPASGKPWLHYSADGAKWARPESIWVDVNEFRRLCKQRETFALAARLYTADLLPSVDNAWVSGERASLRRQACPLLEELVRSHFDAGDALGALRWVRRLLANDPWNEAGARVLMATLCRLGDRAGALAAYRRFRNNLFEEFGVEPTPETQVLHAAIVHGDAPTKDDAQLFALASLALA